MIPYFKTYFKHKMLILYINLVYFILLKKYKKINQINNSKLLKIRLENDLIALLSRNKIAVLFFLYFLN